MEYLLNSAQMKRCDRDTIEKIGIPSLVLMERAALAVVEEIEAASLDLRSVLVVCGSGNNGGDGFAVARLLSDREVPVTVVFAGREESLSEETKIQKKICENCGIKISTNFEPGEYTTIVDAIFGIGLSRKVEGRYAELIHEINAHRARTVAIDIPSGISADTGRVMGTAVKAELTVTFGYRKIGQILFPGTQYCGKIVCRDIGIRMWERAAGDLPVFTYGREDLAAIPRRRPYSNKGTYGKVLLVAGSQGMSGACYLAALAAYRSGSGLVRVFTPGCNRQVIQASLPEAIVTVWDPGQFPEEELALALEWADVTGIGPGFGTGSVQKKILAYVLDNWKGPLVIDADGLNLLAQEPHLLAQTGAEVIVTPHIGEMARLTAAPRAVISEDILSFAEQYADRWQAVCVLKDARTAVSDGKQVYVNTSGNSGMAVGGSGDVLTGVICGLLAQGMKPYAAACTGVYVHGLAGDAARERLGEYGMLAGDIADQIGRVLQRIDKMEEA